jgi:nucleoside-diphosphate-sugar epimerase
MIQSHSMNLSDPILITGASGFVGQNLLPFLTRAGFTSLPLSLRNTDWRMQLNEPYNAVIHLAGKAHDTKNTSAPEAYFQINTELTKQLFDAFIDSNASDFIYFSSVKACADTVAHVLTEQHLCAPSTPYGRSKLDAEAYILSKSLPAGKRVFIIRPCMIHGPGNKGNLNLLYKFVAKGIPYPLAAFQNKRSFLSIDNLCFAIKEILQKPEIAGGIYNLADDDALSTNEVVRTIATAIGRKPLLWHVPQSLLNTCARLGDLVKLPLNSERLKKLTENYVVSNEKIKQALNINSFPISAREGLIKTIKSFSAQ